MKMEYLTALMTGMCTLVASVFSVLSGQRVINYRLNHFEQLVARHDEMLEQLSTKIKEVMHD